MDAFFASVEERDDPSLKGKPIGVIGSNSRTVLVTASYKAREYGVRTGMNVPEAKRACSKIILIKADHRKYTAICSQILKLLDNFSPLVEVFSIDEFFVDTAGLSKIFGTPLTMAKMIKKKIAKETGLTASIGIGPNKLIAKLASDLSKPDGLKEVMPHMVKGLLSNLPVDELCGIGRKTKDVLSRMGIDTCSQLADEDIGVLKSRFGVVGERLYFMARGEDNSPVISYRDEAKEKSMGHSLTLPRDTRELAELKRHLLRLSDMVGVRLRRESMAGNTIAITIRYKNFKTFTRQKRIEMPTNNTKIIYRTACLLLDKIDISQPIRLVGVSVHNLAKVFSAASLFMEDEKLNRLDKAKDLINDIFGSEAIQFASVADLDKHDKIISPSWRPEGVRRY